MPTMNQDKIAELEFELNAKMKEFENVAAYAEDLKNRIAIIKDAIVKAKQEELQNIKEN